MADSASELDLESDASSIDGHTGRCDQLQRQVELLHQQNRMLKAEVDQLNLRVKSLLEKNEQLRRNSVSIVSLVIPYFFFFKQAQAEREEEYISNTLQRQISELKKDKESLVVKFEEEEERLINELNRKLMQLQKDKEKLEKTLAKEQEAQVNKLKRRIERLESESERKQRVLDKLRRDKIELENALEQEQEALVNRLWKKMEKLEEEKRQLQSKLETASAPLSGSSSVQNIASVATGGPNQPPHHHSASICLGYQQAHQPHHPQRGPLAGVPGGTSFDNFDFNGCQSDAAGQSPSHTGGRHSLTTSVASSSLSPRPPPSPMDLDISDVNASAGHLSRSEISLPGNRSHRNSFQPGVSVGPPLHLEGMTNGSAYVARLREEVVRLRAIVAANQADQLACTEQERSAIDENARLRRMLQTEIDRKDVFSRAFSGSESSLEMEDERQFNDASRVAFSPGRSRTTSDGCPSPYYPSGPFIGPGSAFASAVIAAATSNRSVSPRYCRECGQPIPASKLFQCGAVTPPPPSSSTSSRSPGRFVKPSPRLRPPHPPRQTAAGATAPGQPATTSDREYADEEEEEDDDRSKTPPAGVAN
uniref:Coiled-coil domain-containing protein 6 n=2 Tax=Mesocestoides corti TaxID=53468 RepID=A0A5K3EXH1_MESCO